MHAPQLYSRAGFAHEMEPLSPRGDTRFSREALELSWCQLLPKLRNNDGQKKFLPPCLHTARSRFFDDRTSQERGFDREASPSESWPPWSSSSPTALTCLLVCRRAWAGSAGLPSPAFSRLTFSQTGRLTLTQKISSEEVWCAGANAIPSRRSDAH